MTPTGGGEGMGLVLFLRASLPHLSSPAPGSPHQRSIFSLPTVVLVEIPCQDPSRRESQDDEGHVQDFAGGGLYPLETEIPSKSFTAALVRAPTAPANPKP